jgi:hypothetical protein
VRGEVEAVAGAQALRRHRHRNTDLRLVARHARKARAELAVDGLDEPGAIDAVRGRAAPLEGMPM